MNIEKTELLLIEAKMYRNQGQFAEALDNLHRVVNAHPDNLKYKYLLASTYFEAVYRKPHGRYTGKQNFP